jgi:uncharacterized membrane protein YkvA (DUF1232 family)
MDQNTMQKNQKSKRNYWWITGLVAVTAFALFVLFGGYVVSPLDLIPDMIAGFGQIDDLIAAFAATGNGVATIVCTVASIASAIKQLRYSVY